MNRKKYIRMNIVHKIDWFAPINDKAIFYELSINDCYLADETSTIYLNRSKPGVK